MGGPVRVLRLLEYTYENQELADADMARWGTPANGTRTGLAGQQVIRSSVIVDFGPQPRFGHTLNDCLLNGCEMHAHLFNKSNGFKAPEVLTEGLV